MIAVKVYDVAGERIGELEAEAPPVVGDVLEIEGRTWRLVDVLRASDELYSTNAEPAPPG